MEPDLQRARVAAARVGRLATVRADGTPRIVPCCFGLHHDRAVTAVDDAKPKSTLDLGRLHDVRRHPPVSLLVDHYDDDWTSLWWVRLDGIAAVLEPDTGGYAEAIDLLGAKYEQYRRQPPPGPVIAITILTWRAWP